ncbi:MAG: TolC family protein [Bacteroidetes bacterium]|jgi:outer membrane protein TolC|nr:TolC family protein [Bacteroidota bacterium]MBT6686616.1 TolC family protein [Bacteroidota bacterium]MBT7143819.1 TolC family protein [Bacteroidota bacterium]MBT7491704.1 TolC family protein [Bacteroidota bacterium]
MRTKLLLILILFSTQLISQDKITLFECQQKAISKHPLGLKKAELEKIKSLDMQIIQSAYLPKLLIGGQASYQSDVINLDIDMPGINIPTPTKDQYKMFLDLNQIIYDGGLTKSRKELRKASVKTEIQQLEVEMFGLKEKVNKFFFLDFILKENLQLLINAKNLVSEKLGAVKSGVENGILLQSDLLTMEVEIIKLEQNIEDVKLYLVSSLEILEILTGESLKNSQLSLPDNSVVLEKLSIRPENTLFQFQKEQLNLAANLKKNENNPKIFGFGQFAYGKPGLNMLSEDFDTYFLAGIKLSWNFWDWQKTKKEVEIFKIKADIIDFHKSSFEQGQNILLANASKNIGSLEQKIDKDLKIIELQKQILESFSSQLNNGVITSSEYLSQLNLVTQAEINLKTHEIQLIEAKIDYNNIQGK